MDVLTAAAASGMRSRMESLDMLANNIANSSAPGFKADREFYNLYMAAEAQPGDDGNAPLEPELQHQWTDFSQGTLTPTGNPLDIGLVGNGFLTANSPSGMALLTRDGRLQVSPKGVLQTSEGYPVQGQNGKPIVVDPAAPVEISPSGDVMQQGQAVGHLNIVDIQDKSALYKHGLNYFQMPANVTAAPANAEIRPGSLESSNIQPAESAVRLVSVMRQFDMLRRAASIGADMDKRAIEDVAKVAG